MKTSQSGARGTSTKTAMMLVIILTMVGVVTPIWSQEVKAVSGADVVPFKLYSPARWGSTATQTAYSVGTESCNFGTEPVAWYGGTANHPVIAQNLYRLKDGRLQQIGMSWLKHGFASLNQDECGECENPPDNGSQLGVGCSDPYDAGLNGSQSGLGPRHEVNGFTGQFPANHSTPTGNNTLAGRVVVTTADVNPPQNSGAQYFVEGQYIAADDAADGNSINNASYRKVNVEPDLDLVTDGLTFVGTPAIYAWSANQSGVQVRAVGVPSEGRFHVASSVTDNGNGTWRYDYAIHNLNSHRSAASFSVPVDGTAVVTDIGFYDIEHHSGEPYKKDDWSATVGPTSITWATDTFAVDANANALRWGTMFNFWFTAELPPQTVQASVGLFRTGDPSVLQVLVDAPVLSDVVFTDSFESGTTAAWDQAVGK